MELALGRKRADKPGKLPEKLDRIEYPEIGPDKKLHFCLNPTCTAPWGGLGTQPGPGTPHPPHVDFTVSRTPRQATACWNEIVPQPCQDFAGRITHWI